MAIVKQPKTEEELKRLNLSEIKKAYAEISDPYTRMLNFDLVYCPHCDKWKPKVNFYTSKKNKCGVELFACKSCILDMATDVDKKTHTRVDNREKTIAIFKQLDLPFIEKIYQNQLSLIADNVAEKQRGTAFQQMITLIKSFPQYANDTFVNSEFEIDDKLLEEEETKIVQKTLKAAKKRFGNGYTNDDLMYLENEYQDWVTRYDCNTKAQEKIFERLAFKSWEIRNATKNRQSTKDLDKTYQELLSSINILPRQNSNNGLSDSLTFGQLIEKWENENPIPEPDPEFKDVDGIGKLLRVFFSGHLSRVLGLDNGYAKEYDDYVKKYTVEKPKYNGVSENGDTTIYNKLFGSDGD